jgi:1,4-alpha-glucan branching enzyme
MGLSKIDSRLCDHRSLMGEGIHVVHIHNDNRVIAFQRWLPDIGRDVMVVVSLNENTFYDHSYRIGFPAGGQWNEVFNSDVYDTWVNPVVQGNAGGVIADGPPWDGMPTSAAITLPAISILAFARDWGDF